MEENNSLNSDIDKFLLKEGIENPKEIRNMYQVGNFTYRNENKKISLIKFGEYIEKKYKQ